MARTVFRLTPPEASRRRPARGLAHRGAQVGQVEVVQHDDVRPLRQGLLELVQAVYLDFDPDHVTDGGSRPAHGLADAAAGRHVVVLDQDRVIEPEAVVGPAAAAHGVLLQGAQARGGLARVDDRARAFRDRLGTKAAVRVAIPDSRQSRLSATRSAPSSARASRFDPGHDGARRRGRAIRQHGLEAARRDRARRTPAGRKRGRR